MTFQNQNKWLHDNTRFKIPLDDFIRMVDIVMQTFIGTTEPGRRSNNA